VSAVRPTVWPPARQGLVAAALVAGVMTAAGALAAGPAEWTRPTGAAWAVAVVWAAADPRVLAAPVAAGALLCGAVLVEASGAVVAVIPLVAGVVATTELAAAAARVGIVVPRDPQPELRRVGLATALAVVIAGATVAASVLPGPGGLVATVVAAGGAALVAAAVRIAGGGLRS
jgi:hypothetical protein